MNKKSEDTLAIAVGVVLSILFLLACLPTTREIFEPLTNFIFGGN